MAMEIFGLCFTVAETILKSIDKRDNEAAIYFESIGNSLEQMAEKFRRKEIPRVAGNRFQSLLTIFEFKAKYIIGDHKDVYESLKKMAKTSKNRDYHLLDQYKNLKKN